MRAGAVRIAVAGGLVLCARAAPSARADFGIASREAHPRTRRDAAATR